MSNLFDGKKIDLVKFANFPKCKDTFRDENGSGCLFTALWSSMGFTTEGLRSGLVFVDPILPGRFDAIAMWDEFDSFVKESYPDLMPARKGFGFVNAVISRYDDGDQVEALNILWTLIERLPKVSYAEKEDVINSLPCRVAGK